MKIILLFVLTQVILLLFFAISIVSAEPIFQKKKLVNLAAHTGSSYALTHATQVICTKIAGRDNKVACTVFGAMVALTAGIIKEVAIDTKESNKAHAVGYVEDVIGIAAAVTLISIDF